MPLENEIAELRAAIKENNDLLRQVIAASGSPATNVIPIAAEPAAAPAKPAKKAAKQAPAPAAAEEPEPEAGTETTKVEVPAAPVTDDTPAVAPRRADSDYPDSQEHVDVDEVYAKMQAIVKNKIVAAADPEEVKRKWISVVQGYGVDKAADLRGNPAKLLECLKKAEAL